MYKASKVPKIIEEGLLQSLITYHAGTVTAEQLAGVYWSRAVASWTPSSRGRVCVYENAWVDIFPVLIRFEGCEVPVLAQLRAL